ncbi:hypothetical protein BJ875DRAFT_276783 [Amylocarpus encephaloides]|uniref:Microbial-type PARG catalytic domain-containing protein n=1 Tax=Amylocarpus encephaloides TaxID=45428 RepID=A0A9P7YKP9_9HELO|nr:hypothetical protein BJ875DRAFT_276783 [Amylocarpus encephaloides]
MPPSKPKPSEIAAEAKRTYIPHIRENCSSEWPSTSFLCYSESMMARTASDTDRQVHFAFYERDPVDFALEWAPTEPVAIPVIMPANDKRPGGDWEAGVMSPEECLCRRSNLFATLTTPASGNLAPSNYPIPPKAGIFSPKVVVFRNGPERYEPWQEYKVLPVISVCPVKRPKLDSSGKKYSFKQEKELMREEIKAVLRIAVYYRYHNLCIGNFGLGPGFRNPAEEVALMWRDAFLQDPEFQGHFEGVVFAFENPEGPGVASGSSKTASKSTTKSSTPKCNAASDLEIFKHVFKPMNIHGAFK